MSDIPTWHERAMRHPDHQSGMVSEDLIRARMCEEIADLRAEVDRLRAENEELREALKIAATYVLSCYHEWYLPRDLAEALRDLEKIRAVLNDERAGEMETKP